MMWLHPAGNPEEHQPKPPSGCQCNLHPNSHTFFCCQNQNNNTNGTHFNDLQDSVKSTECCFGWHVIIRRGRHNMVVAFEALITVFHLPLFKRVDQYLASVSKSNQGLVSLWEDWEAGWSRVTSMRHFSTQTTGSCFCRERQVPVVTGRKGGGCCCHIYLSRLSMGG